MSIKIKTEKTVENGIAGRKIVEVTGCLAAGELPEKYLEGQPLIYIDEDKIFIYDGRVFNVYIGQIIPEMEFKELLQVICNAGERLHGIKEDAKRLMKLKEKWNGEETFIVSPRRERQGV